MTLGRYRGSWLAVALFLFSALVMPPLHAQAPPSGDPRWAADVPPCSASAPAVSLPQRLRSSAQTQSTAPSPWMSFRDRDLTAKHFVSRRASAIPTGAHTLVGPPCTSAAFAALSGQPLVDALAASSGSCMSALWSFDADVAAVIAAPNIDLCAAQMTSDALNVTTNAAPLEQLAFFYQIAFFHEFYEGSVSYPGTTFTAAQQALADLGGALDLTPPTISPLDLVGQWATSVDSTNATLQVLPQFQSILARYNGDPLLAGVYQERLVAYRVLFSLSRQVGNNCQQGAASPWYSAITPGLFAEVSAAALNTAYTADDEYVVNNALYVLSRFACLDAATRALAHAALTTAYQTHVQYSGPWLRAVIDLDAEFGGMLSNGTQLDIQQIRDDVRAIALPQTYTFDQGRLVMQASITPAQSVALYEAMQEVESQFYRKSSALDPVPGDEQDVLTLVIYGSPDDYATYQPFLYGLSTNNGGIFIESWGTLFTYDRTPQQSIYTLEELLRHEYVHYLDSRYLITGSFGESGTLYEGNRLVWYNEGLAEYLAGSSRVQGVLPRGILLEQINSDASRMTVAEIVSATYGSFTFYRYAGMFFRFLEVERPELFVALFAAVRGNDVAILDALYASMAADAVLQADYDQFLTAQIGLFLGGTGTFSEDVPTVPTPAGLPSGNETALRQALDAQLVGSNGDFLVWPDRFRYHYQATTPTGGASTAAVRELLDANLNTTLTQLAPAHANFQSAVAWCGELSVDAASVTAEYVVEGPYLPAAGDVSAPAPPGGVLAEAMGGIVALTWTRNTEDDLAGYFVYRATQAGGPYELLTPLPLWEPQWVDTAAGTGSWYYVITALDAAGNESLPSVEAAVESVVDVLVINGYFDVGHLGAVNSYTSTLDALGIAYVVWDPFVDGPITAALLADYSDGVVIWACGYFHSAFPNQLGSVRQQLLVDYLTAGGRLILSGAYVSGYLGTTALFNNYLLVDHLQWNLDFTTLDGAATSAVGNGLQLSLSGSLYKSELALTAPAQPALYYEPLSGTVTLQGSGVAASTVDTTYRTLFLAFPFADLAAPSREALLASTLSWIDPPDPCPHPYIRGDVNASGSLDVADAVYLLAYLFSGGAPASPAAAADVNSDASVDVSDAVYVLGYLFAGGAAPAAPFPLAGCP